MIFRSWRCLAKVLLVADLGMLGECLISKDHSRLIYLRYVETWIHLRGGGSVIGWQELLVLICLPLPPRQGSRDRWGWVPKLCV